MTWPDDMTTRDFLGPEPTRRSYLEPRDPGDEDEEPRGRPLSPEMRAELARVIAEIESQYGAPAPRST